MTKLQIFNNNEFGEIRTVKLNGEGWLVGKDIADKLGYRNGSRDINRHVDNEDRKITKLHDGTQYREMIIINESGLYALVLGSELENAKQFRRWITSEVLPSIRKHGAYLTDSKIEEVLMDPDTIIKLATQLKEERMQKQVLELKVEEDKPKVLFAEAVENSKDLILVKEMALILTQHGFKIGQNQLFQYLRDYGFLCKRVGDMFNLPTKRYEHFFKVVKRTFQDSRGTKVTNTPKINGKGQMYFIEKFEGYKKSNVTIKNLLLKEEVI